MNIIERVYVKNVNVSEDELRDILLSVCDYPYFYKWDTYTFYDVPMSIYNKLLNLKRDMEAEDKIIMINT